MSAQGLQASLQARDIQQVGAVQPVQASLQIQARAITLHASAEAGARDFFL